MAAHPAYASIEAPYKETPVHPSYLQYLWNPPCFLRWLAVDSGGYKPTYQYKADNATIISYNDHGYADDISLTAGSLPDLHIQFKKLRLFSKYKGIELETSK